MGISHGIQTSEVETSITPSVTTGNLPVVVGVAPINLASDPKVQKPQILYTQSEVAEYFGYVDDFENYTLCEAAYVFFQKYAMAPVVFINVLDPDVHKVSVTDEEITIDKTNENAVMVMGVKSDTLILKNSEGTAYTEDVDYVASFDSDGYLTITFIEGGGVLASDGSWTVSSIFADYEKIDPTLVTKDDIIGGYDSADGRYEGLELINKVYPYYRLVPTMILAPKYCEETEVAAIMDTKADAVNTVFRCMSIVDIPEDITTYLDVPNTKNANNLLNANQIVCWPKCSLGDVVTRMSVEIAALMMSVDYENDDVPKQSPSNNSLSIDGTVVLKDSVYEDVMLDLDQANYLNENGIMTAINFINGWTAWGNRTACYPDNSDTKDNMIPAKRLMQYYDNSFILSFWPKVDKATTPRLINSILDSRNEFYNGEVAKENILYGKIEFLGDENSTTDLLDGVIQFHNYITPPMPAEKIVSQIELDTDGYENLFS